MKRTIGRTDLTVSAIGLGAMPLSILGRPSEVDAKAVIHASLDAGVTFIDTANVYCLDDDDIGHNERLIRDVLCERADRDRVVVATKGGLTRPNGSWLTDARPEKLLEACDRSLGNLGVEQITLYQLHAVDPRVPFDESVGALAQLQRAGKIAHIGLSNVNAKQLKVAQRIVRVESVQNKCHPFRQSDFTNGFVDLCAKEQITYLAYSPVGGGHGHRSLVEQELFQKLAKKYQVSPYVVILSWLLHKGDNVLPIPGASKIASAIDSPKAMSLILDEDDRRSIDNLG